MQRQALDPVVRGIFLHDPAKMVVIPFVDRLVALDVDGPGAGAVEQRDVGLLGEHIAAGPEIRVPPARHDEDARVADRTDEFFRPVVWNC